MLVQLVRDLQRLKVELRVQDGAPHLHIPDGLPEVQWVRAHRAAKAGVDILSAHRDEVEAVWREIAGEVPDPVRCAECRAWIFASPEGRAWAYCEYLWCPGRTDDRAAEFQQREWREERRNWRAKVEDQFRIKRRSTGEEAPPPLPD